MTASPAIQVRPIRQEDRAQWTPLWLGYNAFYGREGATALPQQITYVTWSRFFNPVEPVFAAVAEHEGHIVGLVHYLFHRSTTRIEPICYLQDLFTTADARGKGIGRALIEAVYDAARGKVIAYDGRETAPMAATPDYLRYVSQADQTEPLPSARA